jgi:hypothetical protein
VPPFFKAECAKQTDTRLIVRKNITHQRFNLKISGNYKRFSQQLMSNSLMAIFNIHINADLGGVRIGRPPVKRLKTDPCNNFFVHFQNKNRPMVGTMFQKPRFSVFNGNRFGICR